MDKEPRGQRREFTDAELRADLEAGLKPKAIGDKYGVTRQAVYKRIRQLEQTTAAAAVAPEESRRYVSTTLNAMEELTRGLSRVNLLQDACHDWLLAPADPARPGVRYAIGARSEEVTVYYTVLIDSERGYRIEKRKATLAHLLAAVREAEGLTVDGERFHEVERAESRHADPRELILATVKETRQTVQCGIELTQRLQDAAAMDAFREEMLLAIGEASPEVQRAIEERLRARLVRYAAASGLGALPASRDGASGSRE